MLSAPQLLHQHLNSPEREDCAALPSDAGCWVCGARGYPRGADAIAWTGHAMTDQNQCRDPAAEYVCEACVYLRSKSSPVPGRLPGPCSTCKGLRADACAKCEGTGKNSAGGNWRNFSALFDAGSPTPLITASKGEKPAILAFLRAPKRGTWFAAIADSGQKQVIPYTPINHPMARGRVLFDDTIVLLPDAAGWRLVDDMRALLTAGGTKEEVESGRYNPGAWTRAGELILRFEETWSSQRGGAFFTLALWLSQRDEDAVQQRMQAERDAAAATKASRKQGKQAKERGNKRAKGDAQDSSCRGDPGMPTPISGEGRVSAVALGRADESSAISGTPHEHGGGVGLHAAPQPSASGTGQLGLFGDVGAHHDGCRGGRRGRSRGSHARSK